MQQYLFRGKRKDNNQWTYGSLINDIGICRIHVYGTGESREVFPDTVGQCTALKDKNGFDIYEGDIYKPQHSHNHYQVMFVNGAFVGGKNINACMPIGWTPDIEHNDIITASSEWLIVVSNIHDNPELLNPTSGKAGITDMQDPNLQTAEGQQAEETAALESATQDNAMEVSAEEGGTEG